MKFLKTLALLTCLSLYSGLTLAGQAVLTWVNPTQYVDNTPIPAGALSGNRIEWGTCSGTAFGIVAGSQTLPVSTTYTVTNLTPGTWCFRAYASAGGIESGPSSVAQKIIVPPQPAPPSNLQVTAQLAYMALRQQDRYVMLQVGTVPANTACDATNAVIAAGTIYYAIPKALVQWAGTTRPEVVLARCG